MWPQVALGEVATPVERPEVPSAGTEYRQIGVRLWGEGAYERESIDGSQTKYKTLSRVEADDIIVNKIWARNGSVAVVPEALAGCFGSGEFPTFAPDKTKLFPRWIHWLTKTKGFWEQCDDKSRGTSGKNRIRPERFLEITIPLPPLDEQRRVVSQIEELAARIEEARRLRWQAVEEAGALLRSTSRRLFSEAKSHGSAVLESLCTDIIDCLHSNPIYSDDGIPTLRSPDVGWGRLYPHTALKTSEEEYQRRTRRGVLNPGDIIIVREGGGTGKAGIVQEGQRMSLGQRVMQIRPDQRKVLPYFFLYQWLSPLIQEDQIVSLMKGSASPHLNIGAIRKFQLILPTIAEQRRIVAYLDDFQAKVRSLSRLQTDTADELDAMLPSILDKAFRGDLTA